MFTVKLVRQETMKLIEAEKVSIYPAGKPIANSNGHISRMDCPGDERCQCSALSNKIRAICVEYNGNASVYHVGYDPSEAPDNVDLYDHAYIENSKGATTEKVYGY